MRKRANINYVFKGFVFLPEIKAFISAQTKNKTVENIIAAAVCFDKKLSEVPARFLQNLMKLEKIKQFKNFKQLI